MTTETIATIVIMPLLCVYLVFAFVILPWGLGFISPRKLLGSGKRKRLRAVNVQDLELRCRDECENDLAWAFIFTTTSSVQLGRPVEITASCDNHKADTENQLVMSLGHIHRAFPIGEDGIAEVDTRFWEPR